MTEAEEAAAAAAEKSALEAAGGKGDDDTALGAAGAGGGDDTVYEFPDKFKGDDGEGDVQGLLKSYGELEGILGSQGKPPETVDGYEVELEGKFPEGTKIDEEGHKEFLGRCHEKGLTNDMVNFIMDEAGALVTTGAEVKAEGRAEAEAALRESFGDQYDSKMIAAFNAFNAAGIEGVDMKEVGNNPAMVRILAKLGENLTEDLMPSKQFTAGGGMSDEELESLMKGPAYFHPEHADHAAVKAKVTAHFKAKFAKKK